MEITRSPQLVFNTETGHFEANHGDDGLDTIFVFSPDLKDCDRLPTLDLYIPKEIRPFYFSGSFNAKTKNLQFDFSGPEPHRFKISLSLDPGFDKEYIWKTKYIGNKSCRIFVPLAVCLEPSLMVNSQEDVLSERSFYGPSIPQVFCTMRLKIRILDTLKQSKSASDFPVQEIRIPMQDDSCLADLERDPSPCVSGFETQESKPPEPKKCSDISQDLSISKFTSPRSDSMPGIVTLDKPVICKFTSASQCNCQCVYTEIVAGSADSNHEADAKSAYMTKYSGSKCSESSSSETKPLPGIVTMDKPVILKSTSTSQCNCKCIYTEMIAESIDSNHETNAKSAYTSKSLESKCSESSSSEMKPLDQNCSKLSDSKGTKTSFSDIKCTEPSSGPQCSDSDPDSFHSCKCLYTQFVPEPPESKPKEAQGEVKCTEQIRYCEHVLKILTIEERDKVQSSIRQKKQNDCPKEQKLIKDSTYSEQEYRIPEDSEYEEMKEEHFEVRDQVESVRNMNEDQKEGRQYNVSSAQHARLEHFKQRLAIYESEKRRLDAHQKPRRSAWTVAQRWILKELGLI